MPASLDLRRRRDDQAGPAAACESMAALVMRDRAVQASDVSFTVTDALAPDQPLVWVNAAFTTLTGYGLEESVGQNCRFLQSPDTDPRDRESLRDAVSEGRSAVVTILNRRKDGSEFWNDVSLSPVRDGAGTTTHYVGVQVDATARVVADGQRRQALVDERAARQDADRAAHAAGVARAQADAHSRRLALLAEASRVLTTTLDLTHVLDRVGRLCVPAVADWSTILLPASVDAGDAWRTAGHHGEAGRLRDLDDECARLVERLPGTGLSGLLARTAPSRLDTSAPASPSCSDVEHAVLAFARAVGSRSLLCVPLVARRQLLGVLLLGIGGADRQFEAGDVELAADLGGRTALAIEAARLYGREHQIAVGLQRSLLPALPELPGLVLAAQYLPSDQDVQVGGDWWDVFGMPDGATGLAIGDVMGHDITAAAAMGQLRSVLRTCAWSGASPAGVLDRLDELVQHFDMAQYATCIYARLEPARLLGGRLAARLSWASAGHLPMLLLRADGSVETLLEGRGLPVGVPSTGAHEQAEVELYAGDSVLLFTDGLIESRAGDIELDLHRLVQQIERHRPQDGPQALVQALTTGLSELDDDVAVLVVQFAPGATTTP